MSDLPDLRRHWRDDAACRHHGNDAWFPFDATEEARRPSVSERSRYSEAKAVCLACPVRSDCLNYALDNHIAHGMWGGITPRARQQMTRSRGYTNQMPPTRRTCRECGDEFVAVHNSEWLCSDDCRLIRDREAQRRYQANLKARRKTATCRWCDGTFTIDARQHGQPRYCSDACRENARRQQKARHRTQTIEARPDALVCPACGQPCIGSNGLYQHMNAVHERETAS